LSDLGFAAFFALTGDFLAGDDDASVEDQTFLFILLWFALIYFQKMRIYIPKGVKISRIF
jgi:hypothetical protein